MSELLEGFIGKTVISTSLDDDGNLGVIEFSDGSGLAFNWPQTWGAPSGSARVSTVNMPEEDWSPV